MEKKKSAHSHHTHGVDPHVLTSQRGLRAVEFSLAALAVTAGLQVCIFLYSGSVALLADTIHNLGDAATAIPLWLAFQMSQRPPSRRFTYGLGRLEDLAGLFIIAVVLASAALAGYESIQRFVDPRPVSHIWAVAGAAVIGFLGNEAVARYRIRVGTDIGSMALVADGHHARIDGLTSLAVLFGALGVWLGYPMADPIAGLLITAAILRIVWQSGKSVFTRLLDGIDPDVVDQVREAARHVSGVLEISEVHVRWLGHRLYAEMNITVDGHLTVSQAHRTAVSVRHELLHHLKYLYHVTVHVDPPEASGESHHRIRAHEPGPEQGPRHSD